MSGAPAAASCLRQTAAAPVPPALSLKAPSPMRCKIIGEVIGVLACLAKQVLATGAVRWMVLQHCQPYRGPAFIMCGGGAGGAGQPGKAAQQYVLKCVSAFGPAPDPAHCPAMIICHVCCLPPSWARLAVAFATPSGAHMAWAVMMLALQRGMTDKEYCAFWIRGGCCLLD